MTQPVPPEPGATEPVPQQQPQQPTQVQTPAQTQAQPQVQTVTPHDATPAAGPFDPAGVRWQGVSPRLVSVRLVSAAITLVLPLAGGVVAAVLSGVTGLWAIPAAVVAVLVVVAVVVPRQVRAWGYAEREDDLLIRKGVMFRSIVVVPYGRMQFVDVQAGPLDRAFGIARVQLHTASPGTDAAIPGLSPAEASRLRDRLAARGEAQLAGL
ncbi:PH domain-containing protein [Actinotalea ferrariae]|uniref:PH domain-containing protein n=1 Tax=Actinotalea ferrariae TaxID=1386098 RepID=UPI001C8C449B|nr:PH domain-containing protein [Actinotalea ferrariae]MBX9246621.1 PH domain-containing protein [Actinotalea ferrariae]